MEAQCRRTGSDNTKRLPPFLEMAVPEQGFQEKNQDDPSHALGGGRIRIFRHRHFPGLLQAQAEWRIGLEISTRIGGRKNKISGNGEPGIDSARRSLQFGSGDGGCGFFRKRSRNRLLP